MLGKVYTLFLIFGLGHLQACSGPLPHDSAFDPDSPADQQAKGELKGSVTLAGETDHAQVSVLLQNANDTYEVSTNAKGEYRITGIVPGSYSVHIGTRYFEEINDSITISLGTKIDMGPRALLARQATVSGLAVLTSRRTGPLTTTGGVRVELRKTKSIRASLGAPPFSALAETEAESIVYSEESSLEGAYRFPAVDAGIYELVAVTENAPPFTLSNIEVTGDDTVTPEAIELKEVSGFFEIRATVNGVVNPLYSDSRNITLQLTAYVAEQVEIGTSPGGNVNACIFSNTADMTAQVAHTLVADGLQHVCVRFIDASGNKSEISVADITVDGQGPIATSVSFSAGAEYLQDPSVAYLSFVATDLTSGVAKVLIAEPAAGETCTQALATADAESFAAVKFFPLGAVTPAREEVRYVCVRFQDGAGNWSASPVSDSVIVDTLAPLGGAIRVNAGAQRTTQTAVTLALSVTGATEMRLANEGNITAAPWEPFRDNLTWFLENTQGSRTVYVEYRDAAGNPAGIFSDSILLDSLAPTSPSLSAASSAGYVASPNVLLTLGAADATAMQISMDGFFDTEPLLTYATSASISVGGGDGVKNIYGRFLDDAGNVSQVVGASVTLDTLAPLPGTMAVNGGALYTKSALIELTFTASGANLVAIGQGTCPSTGWQSFNSVLPYTLTGIDGNKSLYARFRDTAGNTSACVIETVQLDRAAPSGGAIRVNAGVPRATQTFVSLALTVTGATEMRLANEGNISSAAWEPYRSSAAWFLEDTQGSRTVYVEYRDAAGNTAGVFSDAIILDSLAPTSPSLSAANTAGYVTSPTVQLTLGAVDATLMQISLDGFFDTEILRTYATSATAYLTGGNGLKFIYGRYLDDAGNVSQVVGASVVLDTLAPLPGTMAVNNGSLYTKSMAVELSFTATGADLVATGQGACPSTGYQAFASRLPFTLTGLDGSKSIYARFKDNAGNTTACVIAAIQLDRVLTAPSFAAAVTGVEGYPSRTSKETAWVTLSGLTSDTYEMQLSSDSSFAGTAWTIVRAKSAFQLTPGDGLKTVYVKVRDRADNSSATLSPNIELDQSGPEAPSLALGDNDSDGFTMTQNQVEMQWNIPSDPNLQIFHIERYVVGIDTSFQRIATPSAITQTFTDDVSATAGSTHLYRIRARDVLGNYSSYSVVVEATPFQPISRVFKINTKDGFRYYFKPNNGTFNLSPTYTYDDVNDELVSTALVANTIEWKRESPPGLAFNESFVMRTSNQDNSLVYETTIPLALNLREKLTESNRGWQQRIAVETTGTTIGVAHIVLSSFNGLTYSSNKSGAWVSTTWFDPTWPVPEVHPSIAVDGLGHPHIAFAGEQKTRYKTYDGTAWIDEIIDPATSTGKYTDIAINSLGKPQVAYWDETLGYLKFAVRGTSSWTVQNVDIDATTGQFARMVIDQSGFTHIAYYRPTNSELRYATNKTGAWVVTTIDTGVGGWSYAWSGNSYGGASIAMGPDGYPRIAYIKGSPWSEIALATYNGASWPLQTLSAGASDSFRSFPHMVSSATGDLLFTYYDEINKDLMLASYAASTWSAAAIHTSPDPGRYAGMSLDGNGDSHFVYQDDSAMAGYLRLVAPRQPVTLESANNTGFGGSAATGPNDSLHVVYWNLPSNELIYRTNRTGTWTSEVIATVGSQPSIQNRARIAVRTNGTVHIIYNDPAGGLRYILRGLAGNWSSSWIESDPNIGAWANLALAPNGALWATYRSSVTAWTEVKVAVKAGGGAWVTQSLAKSYYSTDDSPIGIKADNSVVVYHQQNSTWYEKPAASSLFAVTNAYGYVADSAFTFDTSGYMHAAWRNPSLDKLQYSTNKTGAWVTETASPVGISSIYNNIILDAEGKAHIVYYDPQFEALRYATNVTGQWIDVTLDTQTHVGQYASFLVDSSQHSHVFYWDEGNGDLRYIYDFSGWLAASSTVLTTPF